MSFSSKGSSDLFGHIHAIAPLVVKDHTGAYADACLSSAVFSIVGNSLPRTEALRRIPRQALGLK